MMKKILLFLTATLLGILPLCAQEKVQNEDSGTIYVVVEEAPTFPGGTDELYTFLSRNAHFPEKAKADGIQGTVYVTFIVERDGDISNIRILRSPSDELSNEAIRLIKSMPRWTPGKQAGVRVRVQFTLPINFQLE